MKLPSETPFTFPKISTGAIPETSVDDIIKLWKQTGLLFIPENEILRKQREASILKWEHLKQFRNLTEQETKQYNLLKP